MSKKIFIIDDSALMRRVLSDIINTDKRYEISDMAGNGVEAYEKIRQNPTKFDLLILDINMPLMSGIKLLEKMNDERIKIPAIVVSSTATEGAADAIRCLELGAVDFITKPAGFAETKSEKFHNKVHRCICAALKIPSDIRNDAEEDGNIRTTEIRPVSVTPIKSTFTDLKAKPEQHSGISVTQTGQETAEGPMSFILKRTYRRIPRRMIPKIASRLVIICSSTGGPKALQSVIPLLPANLAAPVIIVQHMPENYTASLALRLNEMSGIKVKEAQDGDKLMNGWVYLAKGGKHLTVSSEGGQLLLKLDDSPARSGLKPCGDVTLESLEKLNLDEFTCVVLTGMGSDGTRGIGALSEKRNCYIIAQNEETSTVFAMPRMLIGTGLTDEILPLEKIAEAIKNNVGTIS